MMRIGVLASHGGSVLQAIMDACASGEIPARVALVLSNNSGARALERARAEGIESIHLSSQTHPDSEALDQAMVSALQSASVDWVVLAGYMKKLGPKTLAAFHDRILNTHPALLPKFGGAGFYGRRVHQAVLDAGETESGATVHLVEGDYDTGPILAQVRVPVHAGDTVEALEERVKVAERRLIITTLAELSTPKAAAGY
ncbi:MAG: phosphoribosylglycinamide formyltransferase [Pseudomonadales bacterium]|nr:phosphoribosylglycinamide formyltransferase [Pseudomonadales bacterium]